MDPDLSGDGVDRTGDETRNDGGDADQPQTDGEQDARVPVQVAARAAARLEDAEEQLEALRARVAELEAQLAERDELLAGQAQAFAVERSLTQAGVIDLEAATLLAAAELERDPERGVDDAVAELKSARPWLFRRGSVRKAAAAPSSTMGAAPAAAAQLAGAAEEAAISGDRRALLRYLRMRRGA